MNRFSAEEKNNNTKASAAGAKRRKFIWILVVAVFFGWAGFTFFAQSAAIADKSEQLARKWYNMYPQGELPIRTEQSEQ
jgi:cell division protein DivIC